MFVVDEYQNAGFAHQTKPSIAVNHDSGRFFQHFEYGRSGIGYCGIYIDDGFALDALNERFAAGHGNAFQGLVVGLEGDGKFLGSNRFFAQLGTQFCKTDKTDFQAVTVGGFDGKDSHAFFIGNGHLRAILRCCRTEFNSCADQRSLFFVEDGNCKIAIRNRLLPEAKPYRGCQNKCD